MPFYNCRETLAPALISVVRQTYPNWELLLCDDGSTDGSFECARGFRDERIALTTDSRRRGLAALLNQCIDRARGEYIARMDADDIAYPGRLERQVRFLEEHRDIDLAGSQMLIFGEDGAALGKRALPCDHQGIVANPAVSFGIGHPTWMGRAAWFRRYRYNPRAVRYEDVELLYRAYRESRFANLPEILHAYRETPWRPGEALQDSGRASPFLVAVAPRIRVPVRSGGAAQSGDRCGNCGLRPTLRHAQEPRAEAEPG